MALINAEQKKYLNEMQGQFKQGLDQTRGIDGKRESLRWRSRLLVVRITIAPSANSVQPMADGRSLRHAFLAFDRTETD